MSNRRAVRRRLTAVALCAAMSLSHAEPQRVELLSFAQAPRLAHAALSADGTFLSFVDHSDAHQSVVLRDLSTGREQRTLQVESRRERIRWCDWAGSRFVLCGTVSARRRPDRISERTRLYAIERCNGGVRELNARLEDPLHDRIVSLRSDEPDQVLLQHDPTGLGYPEVSELDIATGALRRIVRSRPPVRYWMSDGDGHVRLGVGFDGETASFHSKDRRSGEWTVLHEQSLKDLDAVGPMAIGGENDLYVLKHHQGRAALFRMGLQPDQTNGTLLFADQRYDVTGPITLDPRTQALLSVQYVRDHEEVHVFDAAEQERREWLNAQLPGLVNLIVDRSDDGRHLLVRSSSDVDPVTLHLFDTAARTLRTLGHEYPALEGRSFARMQPISYEARDGQIIPGFLTLPVEGSPRDLPAIVLPHGGPETRTIQTFDPLVQFLAARGYAVLQPNFRGSFGYGAAFAAAGMGQWGGVIHNDITDATRWLVTQGIADPARMCIAGLSFGGYAALLGAARESQWYACAASFAGVTDLMALAQYTDRLHDAELWRERLGTDARGLWQMSPMARVHAVETPILMMHGRLDPVAPISQVRRFARALRKADKPHELIERHDCDHEMTVQSCRIAWFIALKRFLSESLPTPVAP